MKTGQCRPAHTLLSRHRVRPPNSPHNLYHNGSLFLFTLSGDTADTRVLCGTHTSWQTLRGLCIVAHKVNTLGHILCTQTPTHAKTAQCRPLNIPTCAVLSSDLSCEFTRRPLAHMEPWHRLSSRLLPCYYQHFFLIAWL